MLLTKETQEIIDRLEAIDYEHPVYDEKRISQALNRHLKALGQKERDVVLFSSWGVAWDAAWYAARGAAWGAAWDAARGAARGAALEAAWNAAWNAARGAAWDAARYTAITNSLYDNKNFKFWKDIFSPFTDAYEAGLFIYWVCPDKVIGLLRPIIRTKAKKLHAEGKPAIEWKDKKLWYLNGVKVPQYLAETPAQHLSIDFFKEEKNAEVRAEFIRKYGIERMKSLGEVKETKDGYELIDMSSIFRSLGYAPYLLMRNPSTGTFHMEGVPPEVKTIEQALCFRNGTEEKPIVLR